MIDEVSNEGNAPPEADEEASAPALDDASAPELAEASAPALPEASAAALSDAPAEELELGEASALELGDASSDAAADAEAVALGDVLAEELVQAARRRPTDTSASALTGRKGCRMRLSPRWFRPRFGRLTGMMATARTTGRPQRPVGGLRTRGDRASRPGRPIRVNRGRTRSAPR
jgi:hypothetical protein